MSIRVIGVGEVLWDLLPTGPEMGGAPANFAFHARALGANASVISRVGDDSLGRAIGLRLDEMGIGNGTMQVDANAPTGTVAVSLSGNGVPHYLIHEQVAWDSLVVTAAALEAVGSADAICFGTLAQRSEVARQTIQRLVAAAPAGAVRVLDVNLRENYFSREIIEQSLHLANVLKCNDSELPVLARLFGLAGSPQQLIQQFAQRFNLQLVALTRGPAGSLLFQASQWSDCPSVPIRIVDTVGAGDAFTAALVMGMLHKMKLDELNALADEVARYVCSCVGATPPIPQSLRKRFVSAQLAKTNSRELSGVKQIGT